MRADPHWGEFFIPPSFPFNPKFTQASQIMGKIHPLW